MKILSIGTDREILNAESDARSRMLMYAPLVEEMHIHCTSKVKATEEKIASNIWIYSSVSWLRSIFLCNRIIKEKNIDVIVSPDPFAKAWICILLAWIHKKKFLLSVYGGNIFDPHWKKLSLFNRIYSKLGAFVFRKADAIQTDGLETYNELNEYYGEKVFWKPMVPANINELLAIEKHEHNEKPNILYIGRLIKQKNIPFLARVIEAVKDLASVTVVGHGSMKKVLPADVEYFPRLHRNEIVERFRKADLFVLTSYFEGFARVIMEAAAAGVPVVTTKVSGVQGIVENGVSGYVFDQGEEKAFIEAVELLVRDGEKRRTMGVEIREKAKQMLSIETMLTKQKEVYDYLSNQK